MNKDKIINIIERNKDEIAFIIGNGINRYPNNLNIHTWDDLLLSLWRKASNNSIKTIPKGISKTEFYDIVDLEKSNDLNLQIEVSNEMRNWEPFSHHFKIINRIRELNAPVLTTNFDETFAKSLDLTLMRTEMKGFSDFYPWTSYHGNNRLDIPTDGFGVWYINGMINYHRSIRLGLSHYMGSVERARNLIHKGNEERLFSGKNVYYWSGYKTWLHIIFNKSLFIFGLGLNENETFLRWILIERIKYFKRFPNRKLMGWYISKRSKNNNDLGRNFFLKSVGFEIIEIDHYNDLYDKIWY